MFAREGSVEAIDDAGTRRRPASHCPECRVNGVQEHHVAGPLAEVLLDESRGGRGV